MWLEILGKITKAFFGKASPVVGVGAVIAILTFVTEYGGEAVCFNYRQLAIFGLIVWAFVEVIQIRNEGGNKYD